MYNKKTLSKATAELDKAKAPKKPKDIITDPMGQWKYPGLPTRIPGNDITMKGVGYPVLGVANNGQRKIMLPGADYTFPGADYVDEYPQMKKGGTKKKRKTKSIMGINKLMQKGPLFEDYSKKMYDPNVNYFQDGGDKKASVEGYQDENMWLGDKYKDLGATVSKGKISASAGNYFPMMTTDPQSNFNPYVNLAVDLGKDRNLSFDFQPDYTGVNFTKSFQEGGAKTLSTSKSKDGTITNKVRRDGKTFLQVKSKDGKYYEKEIPTVTRAKGFEAAVSKSIGNPMDRAYDYVEGLRTNGEDPQDNLRHATAGRYAAEGLLKNAREGYIPFPDAVNKATSWLTANALGVGHELSTIFQDKRPWGVKLREAGEDIYNNGVGVNQGLSDKSNKDKTQNLKDRSLNYELPDGYGEEHPFHNKWVDPYSKKQEGGPQNTSGPRQYMDEYEEEQTIPEFTDAYMKQRYKVEQSNKKAQDFNKTYAESENYKRLLEKQGYTPEEIKNRIASVTGISDFNYTDNGPSWVGGDPETGKEFITYNVMDQGDWANYDSIAGHEWGHVGVESGQSPLKQGEQDAFINRLKIDNVNKDEGHAEHDKAPQENRADLLQLRQQLQEAGLFDSTKTKEFTKDHLKEYKKLRNSSEENYDKFHNRMFRLYDDKDIIWLMNNIAQNNNKQNTNDDLQTAQYGIEMELTPDEIEEYRKGGYIVEDISVPELNQAQKGGAKDKYATHIGDDGTVGSTNVHTDKNGTITTKVQDSKGITHYKVKTKDGKVFYKQDASTTYPKNNSVVPENYKPDPRQIEMNDGPMQSVDDFWTLPIGMSSAGVRGTIGLAKGLTSLGRNAAKSSLVQATKQGFNQSLIKSLPGSNLKNLVNSYFTTSGINNYIDQNSDVRRATKNAYDDPTLDNVVDAVGENTWNALNFSGLNVGKGVKQLGKYATTQTPLKNTYKVLPEGTFKNYSKLKTKGKSYRVAGHDAHADFTESGLLRSKLNLPEKATILDRMEKRPTAFPSFQKNYADLSYLPENGGVVFETSLPTFKRGQLNPVTGEKIKGRHYAHRVIDPQTGKTLTEIPASDIDVYEGSANWLKGHKKISGQQPQASANKNKIPGLPRVVSFLNGLNYGMNDIIKGRKFSETFPITKKQKAKIEYLQDQAHKGGLEFMNDYLYRIHDGVPHYGEIHPDVRSKIDKITDLEDPTLDAFKRKFDITHNLIGPYGNAQHHLANADEKELVKALNNGTLDAKTVDYIRRNKHKIRGVNWHPKSITLRNKGVYYESPEAIRNVTVHEAGHSMQQLGYGSNTIRNSLSMYDPKYPYDIANENTKFGKEFRNAQVFPKEKQYLWEASPLEVHSEAMAAKDKIYREFIKKGMNKMDALRYLRNPDNTLADEIIKEGSLNRFFKDGISNDQKRKLIKMLPAIIPAGAAVNYMPKPQKSKQMKKGGIVADLTHAEIQDYIKQGYIVEDVD